MLLTVCRNHLLSCVKWHVAPNRLTTGRRCTKVLECTGSSAIWCRTIQLTPSRTETNQIQRLRTRFSSSDHRLECVHLFNQIDPAKSLQWINKGPVRTHSAALTGPHVSSWNTRILALGQVLNGGINSTVHLKGYCTAPPKPEFNEDQKTLKQEQNQCASSTSPFNQGQFKELYENPWTIPNFLCMARIVLSPVLGYLIIEQYFNASLGLFVLAGATDMLDGYIARNWPNQKSALGSALDPLADKILISVLYISLTYAQLIPVPLTALVIARDVALIAAVFYVRYKTVPPPVTLNKFFNPCYKTAQLKPTLISKFNTAIQLFLVAASLASPIFHYTDSVLLHSLWYVTALTTAASGYSYYHYGKKTVEVLNNTK
ncbi:cardiolipin synthase (CMP-forming) [Trichomycterus rosablanca]|uniref:cardiolipin synthase (CMP-forming) n=1 Tax=Trichomycterus rosablanca TaxID=2290929 RepID=UPI002F35755E